MKIRPSILVPLSLGVLVLAAVAWIWRHELHGAVLEMKAWAGDQGSVGLIVFVAAFVVLTCFMVPVSLTSIAAGAVFGFVGGIAAVAAAVAIARALQYVLARRVLQERVKRYIDTRPRLSRFERAVRQDQLRLQFLIRLTPMGPTLVSYLFGAVGVRFGGFMLALIATVPGYLVYVYLGVESTHVVGLTASADGAMAFRDVIQIGGLLISVAVLVIITRSAIRAVNRAAEAQDL